MSGKPTFISAIRSAFTVSVAFAALPLEASAEKRARAPIVFAGDNATRTAATPAAATSSSSLATDKISRRIEFRYPDKPGEVFGAGAGTSTPAAPQAAPAAWTASQGAAPLAGPTRLVPRDPALSPGAFDARAAAAMVETPEHPAPRIVEAALAPMPVAVETPVVAGSVRTIVYADEFDGLPTSNGEIFHQSLLTGAHPTLPLPALVTVSNPANGREVTVRINDRGPFEDNAGFQVSRQVAAELGFGADGRADLVIRTGAAPQRSEPVAVRAPARPAVAAALPAAPADELFGGRAGAEPPAPRTAKARVPVQWPEPPADWDVSPEPARTVAATSGTHYVQLASFSDRRNAEAVREDLDNRLPVEIVPARVNGADYFRVRVGPLADRDTADALRDQLDAEGKGDGRVVTAG
jgi:rare lipoprotein A